VRKLFMEYQKSGKIQLAAIKAGMNRDTAADYIGNGQLPPARVVGTGEHAQFTDKTRPDHVGPKSVADFEELTDPEERAFIQRDAHERVQDLLRRLGISL
jgi:hypothetical protein